MTVQYRAQLQEQQQEGESAAPATEGAPPPDGAGDDDIINSILGGKDKGERKPPRDEQEAEPPADEPEEEAPAEEDEPAEDEEEADATAAEDDAEEVTGDLAAARAAADEGDLDKAFMIAFGKKPEELLPNNHTWTQWRAANDRERRNRQKEAAALETERQTFHQAAQAERIKIHNTIEALKPYEKYYHAEQAWKREGDPQHLVTILEGIGGASYNELQKIILTKTRRSPAERQLQERLQALEAQLQQTAAEREQQNQQLTQQQQYQADLGHIRQNVTGIVTKIPKFEERIYNVILKTRSPLGNTLTIDQAAARVVAAEKRRVESHPFVKKPGRKVPPAATAAGRTLAQRAAASKNRPPLRRDSQNNGSRRAGEETTDDIIADMLKSKPRRAS